MLTTLLPITGDVNLVLARRVKKMNFEVDPIPFVPGAVGIRFVRVTQKNYDSNHVAYSSPLSRSYLFNHIPHVYVFIGLMEEIKGGNTGPTGQTLPARPELEIFTVGVVPRLKIPVANRVSISITIFFLSSAPVTAGE
jgi:hypothetical protein